MGLVAALCILLITPKPLLLLYYNSLSCGTDCYLGRPQARPISKKNRRLVLADASQEGEPCSEIPLNPPSFSLAAGLGSVYFRSLICC